MALFQYKAYTESGKKIAGVIDADTLDLAKEKLKRQQIFLTDIYFSKAESKEMILAPSVLLGFTRELSQLLKAGLPLYESLLTIEEKYRKFKFHAVFLDLCDQLKNGKSFSSALAKYPKTFHEIYLSMVRSAEQSGSLEKIFDELTLLLTKQQKLKKQLFSALAYPAFLGSFCLIVITALFFFVVPSIEELFSGRNVHSMTAAILFISKWLNTHVTLLLTGIFVLLSSLFLMLRQKKWRVFCAQAFSKTPFFKTLFMQSSLASFCRSLSLLLKGGVPLMEALPLSRKVVKNALLEKVFLDAEAKMIEGKKLSFILERSSHIPSLMARMFAIAEETGNMEFMVKSLADIYEEEVDRTLQQLTTFLQPAILLILGAIVGIVVLSVLLPLTDVSSFMSS